MPRAVVAVTNLNRMSMLQRCTASLQTTPAGEAFEFMVWDGGSSDASRTWLQSSGMNVQYDDLPEPGC